MIDINQLHPLPRYGLAVLQYDSGKSDMEQDDLLAVAADYIEEALTKFIIAPRTTPASEETGDLLFGYYADVVGAKQSKKSAASGFYTAPHILTGDRVSAGAVAEAQSLIRQVRAGKMKATIDLKKSFAPTTSKLNAGKRSMAPPKVSFLEACLTMVGALTHTKLSAYDYNIGSNVGVIPDLPLTIYGSYLRIIEKLLMGDRNGYWTGRYKSNKYSRPKLYKGNYRGSPTGIDVGALGLLAAIGRYAAEGTYLDAEEAKPVLEAMANRPIYLFANGGSSQQHFSHHLIGLALTGELHTAAEEINRVEIISIEGSKFSNPKWDRFKISAGHFFTLFSSAYAQDFFAYRAVYPIAFSSIFKTYFMQVKQIPPTIVESAEAYGKHLNYAAFLGARNEVRDDKRRKRKGLSTDEYKNRILTQLESSIGSAKSGADLISRLSTIVGRSANLDFPDTASAFMRESITGEHIDVNQAKQLATAFMRLQAPKKDALDQGVPVEQSGPGQTDESTNDGGFDLSIA